MRDLRQFALGLAWFIACDLIGIYLIVEPMYAKQLGMQMVQGQSLDWRAGLATWVLIVLGYRVFAYPKALASSTIGGMAFWGGLYGFVVYGVFTLTNLSVLKCWSTQLAVCDLASGTALCALLSLFMCRYKVR